MNPYKLAMGIVLASLQSAPVFAACTAPPDVLPIALPKAEAASATRIGAQSTDGTAWIISGVINRCTEGDTLSAEFRTPTEMGLTKRATIQMAISGVTVRFGNELVENNPTEWKLVGSPAIGLVDKNNTDPSKNQLKISWSGIFANLTQYQLSYTIFIVQE